MESVAETGVCLSQCRECSLNNGKPVLGTGNRAASIMLIGEAPGEEEEQSGRPFVGDAGKDLNMYLAQQGMDRSTMYITNTVKCRPPANRKSSAKERACCKPLLDAELAEVNPELVVLLGDTAVQAFFPDGSVKDESGTIRVKDGRKFLIAYHPAAPLYRDVLRKNLEATFAGIRQSEQPARLDLGQPCGAVDVEVDENGRPYSYAQAAVLDGRFFSSVTSTAPTLYERRIPWIFHNARFDLKYLPVKPSNIEDTSLIAYLLDLPVGLKELSWSLLGRPLRTLRQIMGTEPSKGHMADFGDEVRKYNAADAEATILAYQKMALPRKLYDIYKDVDLPLMDILDEMEANGLLVDRTYLGQRKVALEEEIAAASEWLISETGMTIKKSVRNKKLAEYLRSRGIATPKLTEKSGAMATDEGALLAIRHLAPEVIDAVLAIRGDQKMLSTYVLDWLKRSEHDERVYPRFNQVGTRTRRLSSSNPDGQNIPPEIQKAVVAPPGYVLVEFDADQIEMREIAVFSQEPELIDVFNTGQDVHARASTWLFGDVTPAHRYIGKRINFAVAYGGGPSIIAEKAEVALDVAKQFHQRYFEHAPMLKRWIAEQQQQAQEDGVVYGKMGTMRRLRELESPIKRVRSKGLREAINTPIQMTAADILRVGMVKGAPIWHSFGAKLILQVHDALFFYVPEESLEEFVPAMKGLLEEVADGIMGVVPFPFSVKVGYRWGNTIKC